MRTLLFFLLLPVIGFSQLKLDSVSKTYSYSKVFAVELSKKQLHEKAYEWIAINFNDANNVIKMNTDEKIITKGIFSVQNITTIPTKIGFTMNISFKEGRYKLDLDNFKIKNEGQNIQVQKIEMMSKEEYYDMFLNTYMKLYSEKKAVKMVNKYFEDNPGTYELYKSQYNSFVSNFESTINSTAKELFTHIKKSKSTNDDW